MKNFTYLLITLAYLFADSTFAANKILRAKLTGNGYSDETVIRSSALATDGFDAIYDAYKLFSMNPSAPSIYSIVGTSSLSINSLPVCSTTVISMPVKVGITGSYTITFTGTADFDSLYLVDAELSYTVNLKVDTFYTFQMANTSTNNRFKIYFAKPDSPGNLLPVSLLYFSGENVKNTNELHWATASENNNAYFMVEKSADGLNFVSLEKVTGNGNSETEQRYYQLDNHPFENKTYYRLKQTDFNGDFEYSDIISVASSKKEIQMLSGSIGPNPTETNLIVSLSIVETNEINILFADQFGKTVIHEIKTLDKGDLNLDYNLDGFTPGMYFVIIKDNSNQVLMKQRFIKI
jgi:hypothetical protein